MAYSKNLMVIINDGSTSTDMTIENRTLLGAKPELGIMPVSMQFINPEVVVNKEGSFYILHDRKIDLDTSGTADMKAGLSASDVETERDKEYLNFKGYDYKKIRYSKADTQLWEGEAKIPRDIASLMMSYRERKALSIDTSLITGIKLLHTLAAASATPVAAKFHDGKAINGTDGNAYTMPNLVSVVAFTDWKSATAAQVKTVVKQMFSDIHAIRKTGKASDSATKLWPYARGYSGGLTVRISNEAAVALSELEMFQGNAAQTAVNLIAQGVRFIVNGVRFVVDNDLDDRFAYQILGTGANSPVYAPDRFRFDSELSPHPDFAVRFWRLSVDVSYGTVNSSKNFHYSRFAFFSGVDLTTL